jgi:bifunctional DNA-binding transcriptional regulator/antitoxin component of YhaV-PrlF toxin-antitoxin module
MRKNSGPILVTVGVDEVTGDYMIDFPEFLINDMGWYEGTVLELRVDGNDIVIEKASED